MVILRRGVAVIVAAAMILGAVLVTRALRVRTRQVPFEAFHPGKIDLHAALARFSRALQIPTTSQEFEAFRGFLEQSYPVVHQSLTRETVNEHTLIYKWQGAEAAIAPILLMAHQDVVPVEPGTEKEWRHPPYSGAFAGGYVWGRGAIDNKGGLIAQLEAVEFLLAQGFRPKRTIYFVFGHDEELGGTDGAAAAARLLAQRSVRFDAVLDEGMLVTDGKPFGLAKRLALVGIAEKGYLSVTLTVRSAGGHSSMPPKQTSVGILSAGIVALERNSLPASLTGPTRTMIETLAPEMPFARRVLMSNLWLFSPLITAVLESTPAGNASVRTTAAPTMVQGSPKDNVLPQRATAVVNFRIRPGDSIDSVLEYVRRTVNDRRIEVSHAGAAMEPSPASSTDSGFYRLLASTIRQLFPDALVVPNQVLGGTDSRHFKPISDNVYRFLPVYLPETDISRVHGTGERLSIEHFERAIQFYAALLRRAGVPN